jgi:hypothetical protein
VSFAILSFDVGLFGWLISCVLPDAQMGLASSVITNFPNGAKQNVATQKLMRTPIPPFSLLPCFKCHSGLSHTSRLLLF